MQRMKSLRTLLILLLSTCLHALQGQSIQVLQPTKCKFSKEQVLLKQNDFATIENAIAKADGQTLSSFMTDGINMSEIQSFLNTLNMSSGKTISSHHKHAHQKLWTSGKKQIVTNTIEISSAQGRFFCDLDYTYSIIDSSVRIHTVSYKTHDYLKGKLTNEKCFAVPAVYRDYLVFIKGNKTVGQTESFAAYEDKFYDLFEKCNQAGIPFIDSVKAAKTVQDNYTYQLIYLLYTARNYTFAAKLAKHASEFAPQRSGFIVDWVLAQCLIGKFEETKETIATFKKRTSSVANKNSCFDELLSSIAYLEKQGVTCHGFTAIKKM